MPWILQVYNQDFGGWEYLAGPFLSYDTAKGHKAVQAIIPSSLLRIIYTKGQEQDERRPDNP